MLPRIANFGDGDPLQVEDSVNVAFVPPGEPLPRDADVILLLGTKSTLADLAFLRHQGWDHDIMVHVRHGGHVLGLCGGYQMLGTYLSDPDHVDGKASSAKGLGLLDVTTTMSPHKTVSPASAYCPHSACHVQGYEIHAGITKGSDTRHPMFTRNGIDEGAINSTGKVQGTYLHGLFSNDAYRHWWLDQIRQGDRNINNYCATVDQALEDLADELTRVCDVQSILNTAKPVGWNADVAS